MTADDAATATRTWLERVGVVERAASKVESLSHGNQQRVQLAAALVHDPDLLVLDEPMAGLDPAGVDAIGAILTTEAAAGRGVLFSSHQLDLVEHICESVAIIDRGRLVVKGRVDDLVLAHPAPLPITSLEPALHNQTARVTAIYGLILMFVLLSQYGTWILLGVVEEKSSRVVEVLLSTLRPAQLLTGKVIGIGAVAFAQGALLVAVALGLAEAVGSDLVHGTAPLEVGCVLVWLVLGYAFYCWVYAAAGSLAERQEHVQTLAFPLQIPILFG